MGCFSTCFPKSKQRECRRPIKAKPRLDQVLQVDEDVEAFQTRGSKHEGIIKKPTNPQSHNHKEEQREKLNISGRKKVTFDLNVKIYEGLPVDEEACADDFLVIGNGEAAGEKKKQEETADNEAQCNSDSSSSSLFSYPPNYRYQNCRDSDDELDEMTSGESDIEDYMGDDGDNYEDDDDEVVESEMNNVKSLVKEESSESLFSLSLDSRKYKLSPEQTDKEVNSPMPAKTRLEDDTKSRGFDQGCPENIKNFDSVLNPVENLTQWKAVKARSKLVLKQQQAKVNTDFSQDSSKPITEEPDFKPSVQTRNPTSVQRQEISVDTSLSSWLVVSEIATTPTNNGTGSISIANSPSAAKASSSPVSFEDRPILGALTVDEIKQFSTHSSPRRSPGRSPDDMPIIGTVGSYWIHTGQGSNSSSVSSYYKGNSSIKTKLREGGRV